MVKKIVVFGVACIFLSCAILGGCSRQDTVANGIEEIETQNEEDYIQKTLTVDEQKVGSIFCIQNGSILYSCYEGGTSKVVPGESILRLYQYDIEKQETYLVGEISDCIMYSGDITGKGDSIYTYFNDFDARDESDSNSGMPVPSLYRIDLKKHSMEKLQDDYTADKGLTYVKRAGDKLISYKGIVEENASFLDVYDLSKEGSADFDALVSKEYDKETEQGEKIRHFAQDHGSLYVLVCGEDNSGASRTRITSCEIEVYDLEGERTGTIEVDDETIDLIDYALVTGFEVFGDYGYLTNMSSEGIFFKLSSGVTEPKLVRRLEPDIEDLNIALPPDTEGITCAVLYSGSTGEAWLWDIENQTLSAMELPYGEIRSVSIDGNGKILVRTGNQLLYGDIDKIPVKSDDIL